MRGIKGRGKQKNKVLLLAACAVLLFTGCGSSSKSESAMDTAVTENGYYYEESVSEMEMDGGAFATGSTAMGSPAATTEEAKAAEAVDATVNRKLIKTVDMNVETQEFDKLMSAIEEQVRTLGGYIENMNTYNGSSYYNYGGTRNADMTIRIPKDSLDAFLNTVSGISNVIRRSDNVEDVTLAYVDLESHREALRTEQGRLLELLEKAESIEDIITIEQRLSDVRYQLESMESKLRTFDNQVDYSTVYLYVDEVEIYTPVAKKTVWERISYGFTDSLHDIGNGFVEFGIWFVINIPYLLLWAVFLTGFIFVVLKLHRASIKKQNKPQVNGTDTDKQQSEIQNK